METIFYNKKAFFTKQLLFILIFFLFLGVLVPSLGAATDPQSESARLKIVRQVADSYIQAGLKLYKQGEYVQAEQSFLMAKEHEKDLDPATVEKLNDYLKKAHDAAVGTPNAPLTTADIADIYKHSESLFNDGKLEEARDGFLQVTKSQCASAADKKNAEGYLVKINDLLAQKAQRAAAVEEKVAEVKETAAPQPVEPNTPPTAAAVEPNTPNACAAARVVVTEPNTAVSAPVAEGSYIDVVNRKMNIRRSHVNAVVRDTVDKAHSLISEGKYDDAQKIVDSAREEVNNNQIYLGKDIYDQYNAELTKISEEIANGQKQQAQHLKEQKQAEMVKSQEDFRRQMEAERAKRVDELMQNALNYQKQQRYEEALGQLESLLAIDPSNERALVQKGMLEDMINFRQQLEMQKEQHSERLGTLLNGDEASIPYAKDITHPKNWKEITASPFRAAEEATRQNPEDLATEKQLNEVVNLTRLTPDMTFENAIEELKNSVTPPLKIVVQWKNLEQEEITRSTPINMDAISNVPLGVALKLLLQSVSGGTVELIYVIEDGVIRIGTKDSLKKNMETRVYDITVLIGQPSDSYATSGSGQNRTGNSSSGGAGGQMDFSESFPEDTTSTDRNALSANRDKAKDALTELIKESIEPDSWFDNGGDGKISFYQEKKLIVYQTPEIHKKIDDLLKEMRKSLGYQIAIEARFLTVGENFLEDIGLNINFTHQPQTKQVFVGTTTNPDGSTTNVFDTVPTGNFTVIQNSASQVIPTDTGVTGSLAGLTTNPSLQWGFTSMILDNIQVDFLLKATQAHQDTQTMTAPKVTVLSNERASLRQQRTIRFSLPPSLSSSGTAVSGGTIVGTGGSSQQNNYGTVVTGTTLNITPIITPDKTHVLLNINVELNNFLGFQQSNITVPNLTATTVGGVVPVITYPGPPLPQTELSRVETRVSVPDGGTLLLGGLKQTADNSIEAGVPVLSKIPVIGRAFDNRSKIKDSKILLILVKPTIILQDESDAEATSAAAAK